jgi:ribonuclease Z
VQVQGQFFMVDCGEGTQLQAKKYGVKLSKIDHILISHLHGDHFYGLIGLLSTMHLYGRKKVLNLVCPPGLSEIILIQMKHSQTYLNYKINCIEWVPNEPQLVLDLPKLTVHTIPLHHSVACSGYLFREKPKMRRLNAEVIPERLNVAQIIALKNGEDILNDDGTIKYENKAVTLPAAREFSYAYCSDTKYLPGLAKMIQKVDLLYHEATFMEDMKDRAENTFHSTAAQAALVAQSAEVKQLIIGHFSTRYRDLNLLLDEAMLIFANSSLAREGEVFEIK